METSVLLAKLNKLPSGAVLERQRFGRSQTLSVWVEVRKAAEVGLILKKDDDFDLDWLENVSVAQLDRAFVISYFLRSRRSGLSLVMRSSVDAPAEKDVEVVVPSMQEVWEAASPFESEIHDLFGIRFDRVGENRLPVLMSGLTGDKGFGGFPLRKDYSSNLFPREGR